MSDRYFIGVDLGGTKILTAVAEPDGAIRGRARLSTGAHQGPEAVIGRIIQSIEEAAARAGVDPRKAAAIGIGAPGPLDPETGVIFFAPNLGWRDVPLGPEVGKYFGVPTFVDNDANLAGYGECLYGAGRDARSMVYLTVSTGIGGGIILDGKVYRGASAAAGELGHMTIDLDGPVCGCGNRGCMEAMASGTAIARMGRELVDSGRGRGILEKAGGRPEEITAVTVAEADREGDAEAAEILERAAAALGAGVAGILNAFNPEVVVLGGGVIGIEGFFDRMLREVDLRALQRPRQAARIATAALGGDAGLMGAVALAIEKAGAGGECPPGVEIHNR